MEREREMERKRKDDTNDQIKRQMLILTKAKAIYSRNYSGFKIFGLVTVTIWNPEIPKVTKECDISFLNLIWQVSYMPMPEC